MHTKRRNNEHNEPGIIDINDIKQKMKKRQKQMKYIEEEKVVMVETQVAELPYISEAILEDILTRIPAETLYKFRYVCKPWHNIITNPSTAFCQQNFPCCEPAGLFIRGLVQDGAIIDGEARFSHRTYFIKVTEKSYEEQDLSKWFKEYLIHACCNGLVLLTDRRYRNYVANPLTKKLVMLPPCSNSLIRQKPEFVFSPSTGEYKVMVPIIDTINKVEHDDDLATIRSRFNGWGHFKGFEILTLGACASAEQLRKRVEGPSISIDYSTDPPITVNGVLHVFEFPHRIFSFDVGTEVCHENLLPDAFGQKRTGSRFVDMGGLLSFVNPSVSENRLDVWILKDFQIGEWTKQHSINMWMGGTRSLYKKNERVVPVMSLGDNGDIIIFGKQQGYGAARLRAYSVKLNTWWKVGSKKFSTVTSFFGCHVNKLVSMKTLVQRN